MLEPKSLLVHRIFGSCGDQSIGRLAKQLTISSTEWLTGLSSYMVEPP